MSSFIHPYNFVDIPADGLGGAAAADPFARTEPAWHDRFDPERLSGRIDCILTTHTPWFIPHPAKVALDRTDPKHKILGYFGLDDVPVGAWDFAHAENDRTRPAIPGSSLRGMVRSIFEAATLSCLGIFDGSKLDFRVGRDLAERQGKLPEGRQWASYLPVRVHDVRMDGSARVRVLDGRGPAVPANMPVFAVLRAYEPKAQAGSDATGPWGAVLAAGLADGAEVAARIGPPVRRRAWVREVRALQPACDAAKLGAPAAGELLVFGYLHRTGPNIEKKHDERVFFDASADFNSRQNVGVTVRLAQFEAARPNERGLLQVGRGVICAANESLEQYARRVAATDLGSAGMPPRRVGAECQPSDFITLPPQRVQAGSLFYALMEGNSVKGLYPVALPRREHEDSRADLLHEHFRPCDPGPEEILLCPACRVFGWVRAGEARAPQQGRIDSVASHVRFTHGRLVGDWGRDSHQAREATLAILGAPRPTNTAFYLRPKVAYDEERLTRWPPVLQIALPKRLPLYRQGEASLSGRKFYRRRRSVSIQPFDPRTGRGILRPVDPATGRPARDSQNQSVHLLPSNLQFEFSVQFDNLSREELGALLFALTLRPPRQWAWPMDRAHALWHAIGHGRPLGLGGSSVRAERLRVAVLDRSSPDHRYARVPDFLAPAARPDPQVEQQVQELIDAFGNAWEAAEQASDRRMLRVRETLVDMLHPIEEDARIHYPMGDQHEREKSYGWFVQNKSSGAGKLLPEPDSERKDASQRLPDWP